MQVCLLLALTFLSRAQIFVDSSGRQTLEALWQQPVRLPNVTEIEDSGGVLNVAAELRALRAELQQTRQQLAEMNASQPVPFAPAPGCAWEGVYCSCFVEKSALLDDVAVLVGSFCNATTLHWLRCLMWLSQQPLLYPAISTRTLANAMGFFSIHKFGHRIVKSTI